MANPVSIAKNIVDIALKIKNTVEKFHHNQESCLRIGELMNSVNAVVTGLQTVPDIYAMNIAMEGLKKAMERSWKCLMGYQSNNALVRVASADNTARMLNGVFQDISVHLMLATFASSSSAFDMFRSSHQPKIESVGSLIKVVTPKKLCFNFEPNKEALCPVTLTNRDERYYVGVWILKPTNNQFTCERKTILNPYSILAVPVMMKKCVEPPRDMGEFHVLIIVAPSKKYLEEFEPTIMFGNLVMNFVRQVEQMGCKVYRETLTATCERPSYLIEAGSIKRSSRVTSIDVHPSMPWIMTGYEEGDVRIWNYDKTLNCIMYLQLDPRHAVRTAKFIPQFDSLAVGQGNGFIHMCRYMVDTNKLYVENIFRTSENGQSVDILTVNPNNNNYLLSWSASDREIVLWALNFDEDWVNAQRLRFISTNQRVRHLKFNLRDTNTFACVTDDNRVEEWNIESSSLTNTLEAFDADLRGQWMVTLRNRGAANSKQNQIWNLLTKEVVCTWGVIGHSMTCAAWHPWFPILATTLDDGTVCLWNTSNVRLVDMVRITRTNSSPCGLAFVMNTKRSTRLVITYESEIAFMALKIESKQTGGSVDQTTELSSRHSWKIFCLYSCTY